MELDDRHNLNSAQFALLLHSVPSIGEKTLRRLLDLQAQGRLDTASAGQLTEEGWRSRFGLQPRAAEQLADRFEVLLNQSAELARLVRFYDIEVLTSANAAYPYRLSRSCDTPPSVLYALGRISLIASNRHQAQTTFALAASNGASARALAELDTLATSLSASGGVPVCGHDRPPYQRMALAAQRLDRPTVYVFDRGLREALGPELNRPPFAAARIRDPEFRSDRDVALSPFRLDDHGIGANNRRRDEIVFALADVVIAVDVEQEGQMVARCLHAHRQGRPVWVAAGGREGNEHLRAAGCREIPSAEDGAARILADLP